MNSNSFMRVQVRVQKKYFFEFKFKFGKMIEFFRVQVRVRSPDAQFKFAVQVRVRSPTLQRLGTKLYSRIATPTACTSRS